MITYNNRSSCSLIFFIWTGSVVLHASAWAVTSSLITLAIVVAREPWMMDSNATTPAGEAYAAGAGGAALLGGSGGGGGGGGGRVYMAEELFEQPYAHHIVSFLLSFLMVFRVQISYYSPHAHTEHTHSLHCFFILHSLHRCLCTLHSMCALYP